MSDLKQKAKELSEDFLSLEVVKKYLACKEALFNDEEANLLKKEIVDSKKNLKNIPFEKRGKEVKRIKELENQYDSLPLVVNNSKMKEEVDYLLQPIKDLFIL